MVAMALDVSVGRVAAASLGVSDRTKVRSVLGWTEPTTKATFPLMQGSGQAELLLLSTGGGSIRFGATALSEGQPSPAGGLTEQQHGPGRRPRVCDPGGTGAGRDPPSSPWKTPESSELCASADRARTSAPRQVRSPRPTPGWSFRRSRAPYPPVPCW